MNSGSGTLKGLYEWAKGRGFFLSPPSPVPRPPTPLFKPLIAVLSLLFPLSILSQIPTLPGWPQAVQAPTVRPIYIADIDDDGVQELVMMTIGNNFQNAMLYAFKSDGTVMPEFPIAMGHFFEGDPAIFDFNDDGSLELAVSQDRNLYLRDQQGNEIWTIPYDGPIFQSTYHPFHVAVDDLDNDGNKEIIVTCYSGGAVFVFDAQGGVRPGWPVLLTRPSGWTPPPIYKSASIGDIDRDGVKEIVVGIDDGTITDPSRVYCFKPDGALCPGFPVGVSRQVYRSKVVLLDIDGDGDLEILVGKETSEFNVYRHDGGLFPGYPLPLFTRAFAVGDVNRDGAYDWIRPYGGIYGYELMTGMPLPDFPFSDPGGVFSFGSDGMPNLCDISDGAGIEIVAGSSNGGLVADGKLFAFNLDGTVVNGFPSSQLYHRALRNGCATHDVDGDGDADICCGSTNGESTVPSSSTVYCWDTGHPYNLDTVDWAMDGFDLGHTGRWRRLYHINKTSSQLSAVGCQPANPCYLPPDGSLIAVDVTAVREHGGANPVGQDVRYSRTLGCGNYEGPVVDHGDGTYTRMLRAPTAACTTDVHAWVNEFKLQDYQQIIFTNSCFQAPDAFGLVAPANKAANQPLTVALSWQGVGTFPNAPTGYDLYFGPSANPPLYAADLAGTQWTVSGLSLDTRYFWKVVAQNACGNTASALWSFTTVPCTLPPRPFVYISPPNGATAQPLTVDLTWQASAQASSYEVHLGPDPDALALVSTVSGTRYAASGLCAATTYYWQIVAQNPCGQRQGAVWSFTTGAGDTPNHPRPVSPP